MASQITVWGTNPNDTMEIVREIRTRGYVQGKDFNFSYNPPRMSENSNEGVYNRHTVFTFYKDEIATWFSLKYL